MSPAGSAPAPDRRRWEGRALAALLLTTTIAYLCDLGANGWANSGYSAAAQAGSVSGKAFLFGSADASNGTTVGGPPAALWPMDLTVRAFGLSSWTLLVPQALMGVGAVALLWATVRRPFGPVAGLLAGTALALTPVAALMFRFNDPDALLVLLMVAACWAMTRAVADGRPRRLLWCGILTGFGFLAGQWQVLLVAPALALTYLVAGPPRALARIGQLCAAAWAMAGIAGSWILLTDLWPVDSRPNFVRPPHNSLLATGVTRWFDADRGTSIAWLLPAALILLIAGLVLRGSASRTDGRRAALIMWGGWLLTAALFSCAPDNVHQYSPLVLAPPVAALTGAGATMLWRASGRRWVRPVAATAMVATTVTAWMLLSRSADAVAWLRWAVLAGGIAASIALLIPRSRRCALAAAIAAGVIGSAGPLACTADTLAFPHRPDGAVASANTPGESVIALLDRDGIAYRWAAATAGSDRAASYQLATQLPILAIGGFDGGARAPAPDQFRDHVANGDIHYFIGGGNDDSRSGPAESPAARITSWVAQHFPRQDIDGVAVYDLTVPY
nr:glycosyltransferase family 39 protein [Nocardia spumae]